MSPPGRHQVTRVQATNLLADPAQYPADPTMAALEQEVQTRSNTVLLKPVGAIAASPITRAADAGGGTPLGDLIADAQLATGAAHGAQIAFMNNGGIRGDFALASGQQRLNYGQVATVQPFNNNLIAFDLSGGQIEQLLNQQWKAEDDFNVLQVSEGFSYRWDATRPLDSRVVPGSIRLNGKALQPQRAYRVVMNAFLADGGDRFTIFKQGVNRRDLGVTDLDGLIDYLQRMDQQGKPVGLAQSAGRIVRVK